MSKTLDLHDARVTKVTRDEAAIMFELSDSAGRPLGNMTTGSRDPQVVAKVGQRLEGYARANTAVRLVQGSDGALNLLGPEGERLIFGLSNPADTGFEEGIDWPWLEATYEAALAHFPWFEHLAIDRKACWWGYYEVTPDHNPVLGRMPGAAGWINACGFSGHGVQQAAAVGRLIAQEATGQPLFIDIDPLRIERFAHGTAHGTERLIV